jgi:ABC-type transporter Mla MlaB component
LPDLVPPDSETSASIPATASSVDAAFVRKWPRSNCFFKRNLVFKEADADVHRLEREKAMFRLNYSETKDEQRWILCGRVAEPWVEEVRSLWRQARAKAPQARAAIDLNDVTVIDAAGKELLKEMQRAGATFVVTGVENRYVVENLDQGGGTDLFEDYGTVQSDIPR